MTGAPTTIAAAALAQIFASGNGVPPTGGVNLINNDSVGGPLLDAISLSPTSGVQDLNLDAALCLRTLATGTDAAGNRLTGEPATRAQRVAHGIRETQRSGFLWGKPAIIVQGRADTLVPVNFSSRYYLGLNHLIEGRRSQLHYYEIDNAQHFDTFIGNALLAGYDTRLVPLHVYLVRALNLMYAHLKSGTPLPPSQFVRTTPRGGTPGAAPAITPANVPDIQSAPAADALISVTGRTVHVPD